MRAHRKEKQSTGGESRQFPRQHCPNLIGDDQKEKSSEKKKKRVGVDDQQCQRPGLPLTITEEQIEGHGGGGGRLLVRTTAELKI